MRFVVALSTAAFASLLVGCSSANKPANTMDMDDISSSNSVFENNYDPGKAPSELMRMDGRRGSLSERADDLEVRAVIQAGRRLGATAGYNQQAELLYEEISQYDEYLSKIFDFQTLLLPEGIIPPVIAQTDRVLEHTNPQSKTIRARVYKTIKDAEFVNPRPPSWRSYLSLPRTEIEHPHPQLQEVIQENRSIWEDAVQEGWLRGHQQARQAIEVATNELERDFLGMQLFHMLWVAEMVEPPRVVESTNNVLGGGAGSREMSLGVRNIVITEDAYFINDSSEWNAIISEATRNIENAGYGLSDIVERVDNTNSVPQAALDSNLNRRGR